MSSRQAIYIIQASGHNQPIPHGSRIGNIVMSSGLAGMNPEGGFSDDVTVQATYLFQNIRKFMEAAGGSVEDILHVKMYERDASYRQAVNKEWEAMFPDPATRPARHSVLLVGHGALLLQAEITAVLE